MNYTISPNTTGGYHARSEKTNGDQVIWRRGERVSVTKVPEGTPNSIVAASLAAVLKSQDLAAVAPVTYAPPVPAEVSAQSLMAVLKHTPSGQGTLFDALSTAVNGMPASPQKDFILLTLDGIGSVQLANPSVQALLAALRVSKAGAEAIFRAADSLEV